MQNTYKLCNLVIKGEKHREEMYLGKTKKDRVELTTVGNSMMADLVLLVNSFSFSFISFLNIYTGYKISVKDNCFTN